MEVFIATVQDSEGHKIVAVTDTLELACANLDEYAGGAGITWTHAPEGWPKDTHGVVIPDSVHHAEHDDSVWCWVQWEHVYSAGE